MIGSPPRGERRLIAAIHDVSPATGEASRALLDRLAALLGGPRLAMLVVPDYWGRGRIDRDPAFAAWLRARADEGVEMLLHGWCHRDETVHAGVWTTAKARHMTAGEGEFLGLDECVAAARIREGRTMIEQVIGRAIAGFVAPAWLYGPGARAALRAEGLPLAEDHLRVWDPRDGAVLARGPAITWASRSRARAASSLAAAALARNGLAWLPTVRVAVHPGDLGNPSLLASIDRTIAAFARRRRVARYAELAAR